MGVEVGTKLGQWDELDDRLNDEAVGPWPPVHTGSSTGR